MKGQRDLKICIGASAGGHLKQLSEVLKKTDNWPQKPSYCVTTHTELAQHLEHYGKTFVIGECNRMTPFKMLTVFGRAFAVAAKIRPDVVITTGALPLAWVCLFSKLFGAKIIWIDSIANVEKLSMSGSMVRRFSDLCITQWSEVADQHDNVEYLGKIV
ncbi:MAG: hypothetical protein V3V31_09575 [Methylococcales bacterium]